ncbi:hypothetical protein [Streptomonospora litoralis]|uniref:Uncharacterized protein n=1 Tax=Streptomonospora litoralis TaxID=2498135 RepID=A0A4P6Q7Z6_9ACTN|nr:hypothetical protein [Streptomonospora litoralis]QBI56863.1 hypothetical protein EKD16_25615 [Streptomonospora litoralis]
MDVYEAQIGRLLDNPWKYSDAELDRRIAVLRARQAADRFRQEAAWEKERIRARLAGSVLRCRTRSARACESTDPVGVSLGMEVVASAPAPDLPTDLDGEWLSGPWCFDCRGPIASNGACGCWAPTDAEPDHT